MTRKPIAASIAFPVAVLVGTVASGDDKGARKDAPSSFPVVSGIGVALSITDAGPLVFKVLPDSVAEKSGRLHKGDRILWIREGDRTIDLKGKKLGDVVSLLRGPVGTSVTLEILSGDSRSPYLVTLRREAVPVPALTQQSTYDALIGMPLPAVEFSSLDQTSRVTLSRYAGQVVVIDFWASWCGTCFAPVDRMQEVAQAHPEWKGRLALLTATVDTDLRAASKVIESRNWNGTTHLALAPEKLEAMKIVVIPAMIILSRDGKIAAAGDPHAISIEKEVSELLSRTATDRRGSKSPR